MVSYVALDPRDRVFRAPSVTVGHCSTCTQSQKQQDHTLEAPIRDHWEILYASNSNSSKKSQQSAFVAGSENGVVTDSDVVDFGVSRVWEHRQKKDEELTFATTLHPINPA